VGNIPHVETRIDTKGRRQPATKAERIAVSKNRAIDPRARKMWSLLKAVEADGYLTTAPVTLLETMTPDMRADMHALGASVGHWLLMVSKAASEEGKAA
jgi:hypothetical protein